MAGALPLARAADQAGLLCPLQQQAEGGGEPLHVAPRVFRRICSSRVSLPPVLGRDRRGASRHDHQQPIVRRAPRRAL